MQKSSILGKNFVKKVHKQLDQNLCRIPVDRQIGPGAKITIKRGPTIIPHFCPVVNRQNKQNFNPGFVHLAQQNICSGQTAQKSRLHFV
jgi:hypothetical protein